MRIWPPSLVVDTAGIGTLSLFISAVVQSSFDIFLPVILNGKINFTSTMLAAN